MKNKKTEIPKEEDDLFESKEELKREEEGSKPSEPPLITSPEELKKSNLKSFLEGAKKIIPQVHLPGNELGEYIFDIKILRKITGRNGDSIQMEQKIKEILAEKYGAGRNGEQIRICIDWNIESEKIKFQMCINDQCIETKYGPTNFFVTTREKRFEKIAKIIRDEFLKTQTATMNKKITNGTAA